jgi:hypothetical protein
MFDDRWSVVSWPEEFGGRGVGVLEWLVFEEEYWRAQAPLRVSQNGVFLLAPTMFEFGTRRQQERYLPAMASGREIWCQGWFEPDAGSDLAGIRSRAARDSAGDGWVLNGQKTWASRGAFAEWCFGIFRTDPEAERHRGLTYFLVAMDAPGVSVRPIPQIDGETGFAEIFFDNVQVPEDQVLGEVGRLERYGHGRLSPAQWPRYSGRLPTGGALPATPGHRPVGAGQRAGGGAGLDGRRGHRRHPLDRHLVRTVDRWGLRPAPTRSTGRNRSGHPPGRPGLLGPGAELHGDTGAPARRLPRPGQSHLCRH